MQSETDILFYAVYHRGLRRPCRQALPTEPGTARILYTGPNSVCAGRRLQLRRQDGLSWKSRLASLSRGLSGAAGALVQQAFRDENGFELVHFGERGEPVSKARFSLELRWESTAYYMDGRRDQLPAAVLSPIAGGLLLTEWNPDSGKYSRIKLVPCALRRGTPEQSLADARLGEPRIWAETSEGDFCYCTEEEAALRRSLVERPPETIPEDLVYRPEDSETGGEESAFAGFTYIANDADTPETETETAGTEPEKTIAEEPSPELPASESPAAAQEGDYAADHELFSAGQDAAKPAQWGTACPPTLDVPQPPWKEKELPLPALNSGLSQLLKLVQAELKAQEQKEPEPAAEEKPAEDDAFEEVVRPPHAERYAVAAKNRHGIVVHAPELKQKASQQTGEEADGSPKPAATPVKTHYYQCGRELCLLWRSFKWNARRQRAHRDDEWPYRLRGRIS